MDNLSESIGTELQITIKDKELNIKPVDLNTWSELEQFVRSQNIKAVGVVADKAERQELIMNILKSDISPGESLNRIDASIHFIWLALRGNPGITKEKVVELLSGEDISEISDKIAAISMDKQEENPTAKAVKAKKS